MTRASALACRVCDGTVRKSMRSPGRWSVLSSGDVALPVISRTPAACASGATTSTCALVIGPRMTFSPSVCSSSCVAAFKNVPVSP